MTDQELYYIYQTEKGLKQRGLSHKQEYVDRLKYENDVILGMGFPGYFLVVQDFLDWCRSKNIYVGPGRGSAAGSLACYCLRITNLDPIEFNLLFERFLNPDRISMPDIDCDVEKRYRDLVIEYVIERFGADHVAHIGTFGVMRAKGAIRSVARTLDIPLQIQDELSKLCLPPIAGKPQDLTTSIEQVPKLKAYSNNKGSKEYDVLQWALKAEGLISNTGVHAAGIVISNDPITEKVPLFLGGHGEVTSQWEMNNIEEVGLIKFDFLALKALEIIHRAVDLVKENKNIDIDIDNVPLDDPTVYDHLKEGHNNLIFQLEGSSGIRDLQVQMQPDNILDITALVAIYRPGPLGSSYKKTFLDARAGIAKPIYLVPELEPILGPTEGWMIYQEQIIEIAKQLCGYTGGEADELRKAVGKKKAKLMAKHEPKFKKGWADHGLPTEAADKLWDEMKAFAMYGFNKSHAAAYAIITYQTAYLKVHYPVEFVCAVMISEADSQDDIIKCLSECKTLGLKVLPPDINTSENTFVIEDNKTIRFGLEPIKHLGAAPVNEIIKEREKNGPFLGLIDFCFRINLSKVNKRKVESLIRSGAFDRFEKTRSAHLQLMSDVWGYKDQLSSYESKKETYDNKLKAYKQRLIDVEAGKLSDAGRKLRPLQDPTKPETPTIPQIQETEELSRSEMQKDEHELLGFYVSSHPLDGIVSLMGGSLSVIEDIKQMPESTSTAIAGVITHIEEKTTKKKDKMAIIAIEDLTGTITGMCFPRNYSKYKDKLEVNRPLRLQGSIKITETDKGKTCKMIVNSISQINIDPDLLYGKIKKEIKLSEYKELLRTIDRYSGNVHDVELTLVGKSGVKFALSPFKINTARGAFLRELAEIACE